MNFQVKGRGIFISALHAALDHALANLPK